MKFHEFLLTFFYSGKSKFAPGTVGSLVSLIVWLVLALFFYNSQIALHQQNIFWLIILTIFFVYGCYASPIYAKQFGEVDHGSIVLDEVVGQILALQFTYNFFDNYFGNYLLIIPHLIFCFFIFRFFDIAKPSVIGWCDRNLKNGFGVMFDDLLSGILTAAIGAVLIKYLI